MDYHRLTPEQISALATGLGGVSVIRELNASRVSLHLLLFKAVADGWTAARDELNAAVAVLAEVQTANPQVYAEVFGDPMVGAWLTRTVRDMQRSPAHAVTPEREPRQIGNVAAAAAVRAGLDRDVVGYARRGRFVLPTLGETLLGEGAHGAMLVAATPAGATVIGPAGDKRRLVDDPGWRPLRRLHARAGAAECSVRLEDGSPYRDGYHAPPSERLTDADVACWQRLFADAWRLITRHLPDRAAELALGLRAVVPLVDEGDGSSRSGTARESVGALGMTRPRSAADFAVTIVHEFQHSKLSAVLDLMPLYEPDGSERHQVAWRSDARPTSGLIQGVYAFLGVADAWHRLRAEPGLREVATEEFATLREQVRVGYESLRASRELTAAGAQFVESMGPTLHRLLAVPA